MPEDTYPLATHVVRRVGFGALQIGVEPDGEANALAVLRLAVELGVDHIDTAQYYGPGLANRRIRAALSPYPTDLALVSKVGYRRVETGGVIPDREPVQLRVSIEENLRTLGVDSLAAVNLRMPNPSAQPDQEFDDQLAELIRAREAGMIEGIGLSNISRAHLERALEITEVVCVQNYFSLLDRTAQAVLDVCRGRGIAFVPYCPLGWPGEQRARTIGHEVVKSHAARLGLEPTQLVLAWLLRQSPNILLIPGTRSLTHLRENLGLSINSLDQSALDALSALA